MWTTPKTNWRGEFIDGVYVGDKFNAADFNRIKNNLAYWRFLQVQYSLTDTGRVIQKINPKRLTAMRRKMKKLAPKMTEKDFTDWYTSWFRNHYKIMSRLQRSNMDTLFNKLKEVTLCSTQSHSLTEEV